MFPAGIQGFHVQRIKELFLRPMSILPMRLYSCCEPRTYRMNIEFCQLFPALCSPQFKLCSIAISFKTVDQIYNGSGNNLWIDFSHAFAILTAFWFHAWSVPACPFCGKNHPAPV